MNTRRRLFFLISIMAVVSLLVTGSVLYTLYQVWVSEMEDRLLKGAQNHARLIEVMMRAHESEPERALPVVEEAHEQMLASTQSTELLVARRRGEQIEFLVAHRLGQHLEPQPIPFEGPLGEAARNGLLGKSGALIGLDYRGTKVIAGYEPIKGTDWAVVYKVDLKEVQAPFRRAALFGVLLDLGLVLLAAVLFVRFTDPLFQRLEESQQRFSAVFHQSFNLLWTLNPNGTVVEVNRTALDVAGVIVSSVSGKLFWETRWWPEEGKLRDRLQAAVWEAAEGNFARMEVEARGFGNRTLTLDVSLKPVTNRKGAVVLLNAEARDITERKQAERELAERTAFLNALIENSPLGIVAHDAEGRVQLCNPAFERLFGHKSENVVGKRLDALISPGNRPNEAEGITRQIVAGEPVRLKTQRRRSDGTLVDVEIHGVPLNIDGEPAGGYGLYEDITERLRAETERERLAAILEVTPDLVGIADAGGRVIYMNRAGRKMVKVGQEDLTGKTIADFHPEWARRIIFGEAIPTAQQEGAWQGETSVRSAEGAEIPVSQVILAHRSLTGETVYLSTIARDITERKRAEEEREKLVVELQEALASIKTLSGLLPICASCKKIRDDGGYWSQIESYVSAHSQAQFSHGICPECAKQLYPEHYHKMFPELEEEKQKDS